MNQTRPFERILVGVDSDANACTAVSRAWMLAKRFGARLDLIHAVQVPPPLWPLSNAELARMHASTLSDARTRIHEALTEVVPDVIRELPNLLEDYLAIRPGHPAKVVLDFADERKSDLIVLGRHKRRALIDLGNHARAILSHSPIPVWNQVEPVAPIRSILVPIDFSDHSRSAISVAHSLAEQFDAEIQVFHCYIPPSYAYSNVAGAVPGMFAESAIEKERAAAKSQLAEWVESHDWGKVVASSRYTEGPVADAILTQSESADLVVMGTHGRTGLSRFFLGSVAFDVLNRAQAPVLVIPRALAAWQLGNQDAS